MHRRLIRRLAAACLFAAAASGISSQTASATDLQVLCPEGASVRVDGADAGVCQEIEQGRYLRDLSPGKHLVEITTPGGAAERYEIELDPVVPGRLDARAGAAEEHATGSLFLQCIPQRCTIRLAETDLENDADNLRIKEVPAGRYVLRFQRGKKTLEAVTFVKPGKVAGVRANFLTGRAGILSLGEVPSLNDSRWGFAQTFETILREWQMKAELETELRRMEALRQGRPVEKPEDTPPPPR